MKYGGYYKNNYTKTSWNTTVTPANGGTSYTMVTTIVAIPDGYNKSERSYTDYYDSSSPLYEMTRYDYGYAYTFSRVYAYIQFKDSGGNYIQYTDSNGSIKIRLGKDLYTFSMSSVRYSDYSNDEYGAITGLAIRFSLGEHWHNPTTGSRSSDTTFSELSSYSSSSLQGKSLNYTVNYTQIRIAHTPLLNSYYWGLEKSGYYQGEVSFTFDTNDSNYTHEIRILVIGGGYESPLLFKHLNAEYAILDDYTIISATSGSSFTYSLTNLYNLLSNRGITRLSDTTAYLKCITRYSGNIIGTTFIPIEIGMNKGSEWSDTINDGCPSIGKFTITNNTTYNSRLYNLIGLTSYYKYEYIFIGGCGNPNGSSLDISGCHKFGIWHNGNNNWYLLNDPFNNTGKYLSGSKTYYNVFTTENKAYRYDAGSSYHNNNKRWDFISINQGGSGWGINRSQDLNICDYTIQYNKPTLSTFNVYRVDSNDNQDVEGTFIHVVAAGAITGTKCPSLTYYDIIDFGALGPGQNINYMTATLKYKKTTDSSWSSTTLTSSNYDTSMQYDFLLSGYSFDATATYEFQLTLTDRFGYSVTKTTTLRPPIILIDYNRSGKSMAFGKISSASASDTIIETIFPFIFVDNSSNCRSSSWTGGTTGNITQIGSNSSNYNNIFVGRSSTQYRRYGITVYDNDSYSNVDMRLYSYDSYLSLTYTAMKYYSTNSGKYFEVNPSSTYCNFNTDASYFYMNKPLYVQSNIVATQSWVNNQSYITNSTFTSFKDLFERNNPKDYNGNGDASYSTYVKIPLNKDTTSGSSSTNNKLLLCWGVDYFSSWSANGGSKTINFPTTYYWYPVVIVSPKGGVDNNYPRLAAYTNGSDSFTVRYGAVPTRTCWDIYPNSDEGEGYWGRVKTFRVASNFTGNSLGFYWFAIGMSSS